MTDPAPAAAGGRRMPGFREFVALIAAMMAINALSIDAMLPALPDIGSALNVPEANDRQWVVTAYLLGFGVMQLVYGPLADRYGRRPVLLAGLSLYTVFTALAAFAWSFEVLVWARVLQGVGAAATRVLAVSIVRDCYSGRTMARVMSLTFIVFLIAPIIAPSMGQLILLFVHWPWIFGVLAVIGAAITAWAFIRLPETLKPENRTPISVAGVAGAVKLALTERLAVGYMMASTLIVGALFAFITSAQQVFDQALGRPELFGALFAAVAAGMGLSSYLNSRIVERLGTRRVSHTALIGFMAFAGAHALVSLAGLETIWTFLLLQGGMMFCFGLVGSNFGSMAMEPLGRIAGTGSSVQGFVTTVGGASIGFLVGQQFDGTVTPLTISFFLCGVGALLVVLWTERGQLFRAHNLPPA